MTAIETWTEGITIYLQTGKLKHTAIRLFTQIMQENTLWTKKWVPSHLCSVKPFQGPIPTQSTYRYQLTNNNHKDNDNNINCFLDICLHSTQFLLCRMCQLWEGRQLHPQLGLSLQRSVCRRQRLKESEASWPQLVPGCQLQPSGGSARLPPLQTAFVHWVSCALECCGNERCPCWALAAGPSWSAALLPSHSDLTAEFSLFHRAEIWPCSGLRPLLRNLSQGTKKKKSSK